MSKTVNDIELLKSCLTGSTKSFEVLVQRYQSLVCALTYGATGSVDKSEELAQETFLLAWKNLRQLKDLNKFKAWLCQITRRVIQSWFRACKRETVGKAVLMEKASLEATAITPTEVAIQQEQQAVVNQAIEIIPEQYRVPLILFYRENKSAREVATIIGLNENTTRQRISRARALLKDQVAAMVETSLAQSKPGKAFTTGVLASVAGLAIKGAATATAAQAVTAGLSALTLKITGIAAGLLLVAGVTYMTLKPKQSTPTPPPTQTQGVSIRSDETESAAVTPVENSGQADILVEETPQEDIAALRTEETDQSPPSPAQSTPYEFEPKGLLSGLITDIETGEPIVDATIQISNNRIFTAHTDDHGFYSFTEISKPNPYKINIDCPAYIGIPWGQNNPIIPLTEESHAVKHFQLARACMVEIQVVDVNGVGIKDAKVVATSPTDTLKKEVAYFGDHRSTDVNGVVLLGGFSPSEHEYLITVWHNGPYRKREVKGKTISYPTYDYAPEKTTVLCTDTDVIEQRTVVLKKGREVHGHVAYADGVPATDIDIMARPNWWHSNWSVSGSPVNDDGTFVLKHVTPGDYTMAARFFDTGSLPVIQEVTLPLDNNEPLALQLTQKSPQSLATIHGTLQIHGEAQSRYVTIDAYSPRLGRASCRVQQDAYGHMETEFVLTRLEPGPYRLTFSGDAIEPMVLEEVQAPCANLEVTLVTQDKLSVFGTVLDAKTLKPIESFRARAIKLRTLRGPGYVQEKQWASYDDEQGRFSLDTVGPGVYQVQILADGYAPALSPEISTDAPEDTVIALTQGGSITGTVTNQQGQRVTGARVIPLSLNKDMPLSAKTRFVSEEGAVVTTPEGAFTLNHLPAGVETLKVAHPDYAPAIVKTAEILEGRNHEGLEITLLSGGTLEGVVYDDQGLPVAKEILYVQDATGYGGSGSEIAGQLATAVTDANGFYRIEHLPTELCYVRRAQTWSRLGVVRRSVIPKDNEVLLLDLGGSPMIRGVAIANGMPLTGTRLLLGAKVSPDFGPFKCVTETDAQGGFTFRGAVPGRFSIHYWKDKDWIRITDIDVPGADLNLGLIETETTQLAIQVRQPASTPWRITQLYLGLPGRRISGPVYTSQPPTEAGQPWIISNVEPGEYTLVLACSDTLQLYQDVVLEPGQILWEVSVDLPKQTGSLSGTLQSDQICVAWQDTPRMLVSFVADDQGTIAHDNIPTGSYNVGTIVQWLYDMAPLAQFEVSAGEHTRLDLNEFSLPNEELATLVVQVVGQNGDMPQGTDLRLSCSLGVLEPYASASASTMFVATTGDHVLHVASPGYKPINKRVHLDSHRMASNPETVVIELEAQ